jgi:MerR family gold-responsive transcriptional activator of gol and ges genes
MNMNIGQAAKASGVNAKLIRHYEAIGIIPKASRSEAGYRRYSENDVHTLAFVRRARTLGFSMKEIKKLVSLWRNRTRKSSEVKNLTMTHIKDLEVKIRDLEAMRSALVKLSKNCHGDDRPSCPIIEDLSSNAMIESITDEK